jgi:hypothetical protein
MKIAFAISSSLLFLTALFLSAIAQSSPLPIVPALRDSQAIEKDLGAWEDVFVNDDQDFVIARRGEQIFSLPMTETGDPRKLAKLPALSNSRIRGGAVLGDKLWLFLESSESQPFAFEIYSGQVAHFQVPRPKDFQGARGGTIQSHVLIRHCDAALLMVSGVAASPRNGNQPVYFWMSLKTGQVVVFPVGWDLNYFSANQEIAVFGTGMSKKFERLWQAVDLKTGARAAGIPDRQNVSAIPFRWTQTQAVKPLYDWHEGKGEEDYFVGVSYQGSTFLADHEFENVYLSTAKANGGFVGFRLRREGALENEPSQFWLMQLKPQRNSMPVSERVTDFAMLTKGDCVFSTSGHGHMERSHEAFVFNHDKSAIYNVLEQVGRLPELDKEFSDKEYVEDKMTVRLVESFGRQHNSLVLCLFTQFRGDMRSLPVRDLRKPFKSLEWATWRRALILTSTGKRYMTNLFREGNSPDHLWLHESGKIITGIYSWEPSTSGTVRKIHLSTAVVTLD